MTSRTRPSLPVRNFSYRPLALLRLPRHTRRCPVTPRRTRTRTYPWGNSLMHARSRAGCAALAVALLALAVPAAPAQTNTWTNPNGGDWNTGTNWSQGSFPNAKGANATFGNAIGTTGQQVTLSSAVTVGVLAF